MFVGCDCENIKLGADNGGRADARVDVTDGGIDGALDTGGGSDVSVLTGVGAVDAADFFLLFLLFGLGVGMFLLAGVVGGGVGLTRGGEAQDAPAAAATASIVASSVSKLEIFLGG